VHPELVAEWHPTRNGDTNPGSVGAGSDIKRWWRCRECNHEWHAAPGDRSKGRGCPVCAPRRLAKSLSTAPRERSLAALYPHLLAEWHPTRNAGTDPYTVWPGSEQLLWWACQYCGAEWQAQPLWRKRSQRGGCRRCASRHRRRRA
jgi:hypothetical protein